MASVLNRLGRPSHKRGDRLTQFRREMYRLFLDHVRIRAWNRVLAVQSRGGWVAEEVSRRMLRGYVCGLDIATSEIESATKLRGVSGRLEFRVWDGGRFPFPDESFDSVLSSFALDRFPQPVSALREMHRVLRPKGRLYLLEPNRSSFHGLYALSDYFFRLVDRGHVRYYSGTEMFAFLREAGFVGGRELERYEKFRSNGKALATAVILEARREADDDSCLA
jgi:ubiquinone/menaquinone biosynthesis C-methylase UbiE